VRAIRSKRRGTSSNGNGNWRVHLGDQPLCKTLYMPLPNICNLIILIMFNAGITFERVSTHMNVLAVALIRQL